MTDPRRGVARRRGPRDPRPRPPAQPPAHPPRSQTRADHRQPEAVHGAHRLPGHPRRGHSQRTPGGGHPPRDGGDRPVRHHVHHRARRRPPESRHLHRRARTPAPPKRAGRHQLAPTVVCDVTIIERPCGGRDRSHRLRADPAPHRRTRPRRRRPPARRHPQSHQGRPAAGPKQPRPSHQRRRPALAMVRAGAGHRRRRDDVSR